MKREELISSLEHSMMVIGKEMYQEQIGISDCSPAQNHVLVVIAMFGSIGIKQLAEKLHITSGAASQHVDALEKAGLVKRNMSPNNRREVFVEITKQGEDEFKKIRSAKSQMLSKLFHDLSDAELNTLVQLIDKVSQKYTK
jgi:MarR family 2-MHQ and catechol resistance regulon transcriptional repressor